MPKPKPLTLAEVARLARQHDAATWEAMTAAERQLLLDMLNEERARHAPSKGPQSTAVDDFFAGFWKVVEKEQGRR